MRDIHPRHLAEASIFEQRLEQTPFAAPEVYHALCLRTLERGQDGRLPALVERERALDPLFFAVFYSPRRVRGGSIFFHQPRQGFVSEAPPVFQVTVGDCLPLGMSRQPPFAA